MGLQIVIRAVAYAIDVPLWIERPNIDLKICTYDRLYQESVVIRNRLFTFAGIALTNVSVACIHAWRLDKKDSKFTSFCIEYRIKPSLMSQWPCRQQIASWIICVILLSDVTVFFDETRLLTYLQDESK